MQQHDGVESVLKLVGNVVEEVQQRDGVEGVSKLAGSDAWKASSSWTATSWRRCRSATASRAFPSWPTATASRASSTWRRRTARGHRTTSRFHARTTSLALAAVSSTSSTWSPLGRCTARGHRTRRKKMDKTQKRAWR
ncbi:hypothetical protein ACP70R_032029 [Stipagrostis hirtigluma subsp. patula]